MTPIDWAKRPLQKYADFSGRAPRPEYWWYVLALLVAYLVIAMIVENLLGIDGMIAGVYGPLSALLWLGTLVPSLAVAVRRLHDSNRSGWWMLLMVPYCVSAILAVRSMASGNMTGLGSAGLLAIVGLLCAIALLVFMILPGTPGDNRFGPPQTGSGARLPDAGHAGS